MHQDPQQSTYWPPGGSPDGDATVFTANAADGSLALVRAGPRAGHALPWRALLTSGTRDLRTASGRLVVPEACDPLAAIARLLPASGEADGDVLDAFADDVARWEVDPSAPASPRWERFRDVAGRATFQAALSFGDAGFLAPLDAAHGPGTVDAALALDPVLADVLALHDGPADAPDAAMLLDLSVPRRDRAAAACRLMGVPASCAPFVTRLMAVWAGRPFPVPLASVMAAAPHVPPEWVPGTPREARAMARLADLAAGISRASRGTLDVAVLLAPARGRWAECLRAAARHLPDPEADAASVASDVADGVAAFRDDVVDPVMALAGERLGRPPGGNPAAMAWTALHGGRGLAAVLEGSREWHARAGAIREAVAATCGDIRHGWPVPFGPVTTPGGLVVEPVLDVAALSALGREMGNCLATYAARCSAGDCAVAVVRPRGGEPGERTVASLTLSGGKVRIDQHKGRSNADAPDANALALDWAVASIQDAGGPRLARPLGLRRRLGIGRPWVPSRLRHLSYDPRRPGSVGLAVDAWSRHLPGGLRDPMAVLALGDPAAASSMRERASGAGPSGTHGLAVAAGNAFGLAANAGPFVVLSLVAAEILSMCSLMALDIAAMWERRNWGSHALGDALANVLGERVASAVPGTVVGLMIATVLTMFPVVLLGSGGERRAIRSMEAVEERRRLARAEVGAQPAPAQPGVARA